MSDFFLNPWVSGIGVTLISGLILYYIFGIGKSKKDTSHILIGRRIQQVSNFIKPVLGFITSTMNLLFDFLYTKPLSFVIRPGVKKILKESGFYSVDLVLNFHKTKIFLTQDMTRTIHYSI